MEEQIQTTKKKSKWWLWLIIILIIIGVGLGIYFWLSSGSDGGVISNLGSNSGSSGSSLLGNNVPQPPALPE